MILPTYRVCLRTTLGVLWKKQDSNLRPSQYEGRSHQVSALPTELFPRMFVFCVHRIESFSLWFLKAAANFTAGYQMNMNITFIDWVLSKNQRTIAAGWLAISIKNLMYVCLSLQAMVLSNDLFLFLVPMVST